MKFFSDGSLNVMHMENCHCLRVIGQNVFNIILVLLLYKLNILPKLQKNVVVCVLKKSQ